MRETSNIGSRIMKGFKKYLAGVLALLMVFTALPTNGLFGVLTVKAAGAAEYCPIDSAEDIEDVVIDLSSLCIACKLICECFPLLCEGSFLICLISLGSGNISLDEAL